MKTPIIFSQLVQPIPLETSQVENLKCTVAGWGRAIYPHAPRLEMLHYLDVDTIGNDECEKKLWDSKIPITASSLCTLTNVGKGICLGDSGGPLVADGKVVGLASWIAGGFPCAIGKPDVFTRISRVSGWVLENSKPDTL